jgi:small subunit ribosomal protein S9
MSTVTNERYFFGVGRRKASTARAKVVPNNAGVTITINKKDAKAVIPDYYYQTLEAMLTNIGRSDLKIDLFVKGGGVNGQVEASRLAIAKALVSMDETNKTILRQFGYLTTDIRKVLSKRPGLRKARKREQWSKR